MTQWFVQRNGKSFGPFSSGQINLGIKQGKIDANTRLRDGESNDWHEASAFQHFSECFVNSSDHVLPTSQGQRLSTDPPPPLKTVIKETSIPESQAKKQGDVVFRRALVSAAIVGLILVLAVGFYLVYQVGKANRTQEVTHNRGEQELETPIQLDPVVEFKKIVAEVQAKSEKPERWLHCHGKDLSDKEGMYDYLVGKWSRKERHYSNVKYDVQKTQSLVSPYTAVVSVQEIEIEFKSNGPREYLFDSEQEARESTEIRSETTRARKLTYVWQDNAWATKYNYREPEYPFSDLPSFTNPNYELYEGELIKPF